MYTSCHYQIIIRGKVQGVFYRKFTRQKALALGLKGTVQNLADGSVKIIAEGKQSALDKLVAWCWQGSPLCKVLEVKHEIISYNSFKSFEIIR